MVLEDAGEDSQLPEVQQDITKAATSTGDDQSPVESDRVSDAPGLTPSTTVEPGDAKIPESRGADAESSSDSSDGVSIAPAPVPVTPVPEESAGGAEEVPPELIGAVLGHAAEVVRGSAPTVVSVEYVEWPDSSLGCSDPGIAYTQVITPGYRIVVDAGGDELDYRTDLVGSFKLCERPALSLPSQDS
ncbi:MAG TPA: hypothetical protein VIW46_00630 [Acidimicrobiia bacterium]